MWEKVKIKEVANQIRGVSYKPKNILNQNADNGIKLLRANNITSNGLGDLSHIVYVDTECVADKQILCNGDILICASSGSKNLVGKAIGFFDGERYTFGAFCKVVRPKENISHKYLHYYFQSSEYRNVISQLSSGANINNIRNEHIDNLEIPLPPLSVQQRIADMLDKADALRRKDQELLKKYDELAQAIFVDMFGDPVKNEKGWEVKPFEHFVTFDMKMTTDFDKHADLPHIGVRNIEKESGKLIGYKSVREEDLESGKYYFTDKHIIYSKIRPNLNKVALPNFHGLCSADSYPLLPTRNTNKVFFAFLLRSEHFLDFISGFSNRANIPKVNKSQLSKYEGISPPIELQNLFANKVKLINSMKGKINIADSEQLFHSLLYKSFNV